MPFSSVFEQAKEGVQLGTAVEHYGVRLNRKDWARCPFHNERTASFQVKDTHFRCFGCGQHGDVIDFVRQLLGLDALGAVRQLDADFHLGLALDGPPTKEERREMKKHRKIVGEHEQFEQWRSSFIRQLNAGIRETNILLRNFPDSLEKLTDKQAKLLQNQPMLEYWSDILANGCPEDQAQIYRERRRISKWI